MFQSFPIALKGAEASCPEIQGEGKPVWESPSLDFVALALEIVSSLEGKESNGVKPMIDPEKTELKGDAGLSECQWDDECTSKQNQVVSILSACKHQYCQL